MERLCLSAIRVNDIVIYRPELSQKDLKDFINSNKMYIEHSKTNKGNIYYNDEIVLQEWSKYRVKATNIGINPLSENDFTKVGEFVSEEYGTLLYKNCLGIAKFKGITIRIDSQKITQSEFNALAKTVNNYIVNLSYDYNQATFSPVARNTKKRTDLGYHVFLMIHNALTKSDNTNSIFKNFKLIENNICRSLTSFVRYENIATIQEVSEYSLQDVFSGNSNLQEYKGHSISLAKRCSNGANNYLPKELLFEETNESFDNVENRFIKYFLQWCLDVISDYETQFLKEPNFLNTELLKENKDHIKSLSFLLNNSFLKSVGTLQNIPMYSSVLTRRDGYRQLFNLYLGIRSMPQILPDDGELKELIENKSLDVLYENYCFFQLSDIISILYGQQLDKKKFKVLKTDYTKTLEKKTDSNYFEFAKTSEYPKIRVHYNKNYVLESYSKPFDPDISLEIFGADGNMKAIYVFDAKFKVTIDDGKDEDGESFEQRKYKNDDISKMHTYRDAIILAKGAYILYPGALSKVYPATEPVTVVSQLNGVGAFPLRPNNTDDIKKLSLHIEDILKANFVTDENYTTIKNLE